MQAQIGKQPNRIYTFNDGWRLSSDNLDHSKDIVPAGSAMVVRRAAKSGGGTVYWVNAPTYVPATFLSPLAAGSRKSHGSIGTFDVNMPALNGLGIECRAVTGIAGSHQIVFTFANSVTVAGATATSLTNGSVSYGAPVVAGNHVTVNLTGVSNAQRLSLNLVGVSDGAITNDVTVPIGVLLGDVNATKHVDSIDVTTVQRNNSQNVNLNNFRSDVNANGHIDSIDVTTIQRANSTGLP